MITSEILLEILKTLPLEGNKGVLKLEKNSSKFDFKTQKQERTVLLVEFQFSSFFKDGFVFLNESTERVLRIINSVPCDTKILL